MECLIIIIIIIISLLLLLLLLLIIIHIIVFSPWVCFGSWIVFVVLVLVCL